MFQLPDISSKLKLDLSPLKLGFNEAKQDAADFAGSIKGGFEKIGEVITSPAALILETAASALTLERAIEGVNHAMEHIEEATHAADRLGITTETMAALEHQARHTGVEFTTLEMAVNHLNHTLVGAEEDGGKAAAALSRLNINAEELINLPVDKQLALIGEKLRGLESNMDRNAAIAGIFGVRAGPQLKNLLLQGAEGMEEAKNRVDQLGSSFSRLDAAKVIQANHAMEDIGEMVSGIEQRLAVGLAPWIDAIAQKFINVSTAGGGIGSKVGGAIEYVAKGIANNIDVIHLLDAAFKTLQGGAALALGGVIQQLDDVAHAFDWLYRQIGGKPIDTSYLDQSITDLQSLAKQKFADAGKAYDDFENRVTGKKVGRAFDELRAASDATAKKIADDANKMNGSFQGLTPKADVKDLDAINKALEKMKLEVDSFGLSQGQKDLLEFKNLHPDSTQLDQYKKLAEQMDKLKANHNLDEEAKKWKEKLEGPAEKYRDMLDTLKKLHDAHKITDDDFTRGQKKADEELAEGVKKDQKIDPNQFATALRAGSADLARQQYGNSVEDRAREDRRKQIEYAKQQAELLAQIADAVDNFETADF